MPVRVRPEAPFQIKNLKMINVSFNSPHKGNIWVELFTNYPLEDVFEVIKMLKLFGYFNYGEYNSKIYHLELLVWWPSWRGIPDYSKATYKKLQEKSTQLFYLVKRVNPNLNSNSEQVPIRFFLSKKGRVRVLTKEHSRLFRKNLWNDPGKEFGKRPIFNSIEEFISFLEV